MKKVSVGTVKDVGTSPKKKKKGIVILVIVAVVLIALFLFSNTGCSDKKSTDTAPKATPVPITTRVSGLEDRVTYLETHPVSPFDPTGLQNQINALTAFDPAPLTARVGVLEATNLSTLTGDLSFLTVRVGSLESYNISGRLAAIEARLNASPTATPLPNGSTPTPTPVPTTAPITNCSMVKKPVSISPTNGNMSMPNGSIMFQWAECNASGYKFYFGTDPAAMIEIATLEKDVLAYPFPAPISNTYYFWRVVAISSCGNQSTMWWFKTQ